jgi:hypothetical protein
MLNLSYHPTKDHLFEESIPLKTATAAPCCSIMIQLVIWVSIELLAHTPVPYSEPRRILLRISVLNFCAESEVAVWLLVTTTSE